MRRLRRLLVGALVVVLLGAVAFVVVRPFRVSVQTLVLLPELIGQGPLLLSATTSPPRVVSVAYGSRSDRMDLYLPSGPNRHPAVLLVLGVSTVPLDDPRVVRVAIALGRLGLAVGVPESSELVASRIDPGEPGRLAAAFELLAARPEVDAARTGIAAFSVGGSLALIAAADPRIASDIAFLNIFGAYADAAELLVDIATRRIVVDGVERPWQPAALTRSVFVEIVLEAVPAGPVRDDVRRAISPIVDGDGPSAETFDPVLGATLSGDAAAIYRLVTTPDRAAGERAIAALSAGRRAELEAVSPVSAAAGLRAPVYLMHDGADPLIPFSHLGRLVDAVPADSLARTTAFRLFEHIEPEHGLGLGELPELWKLYWHVEAVLEQAL